MVYKFSEFLSGIIIENLHQELKDIIGSSQTSSSGYPNKKTKQSLIASKIKDLTKRGEETGIEGNMPKGSSRAYLPHKDPESIVLDGKKTKIKTGTKVAIKAALDRYHVGDSKLGNMQNEAEGGDYHLNQRYRILTPHKNGKEGHYTSNKEDGVFPPLIDHDYDNHEWSHVGHVNDISKPDFKKLTKTETHPEGISHTDFVDSLERNHNRNRGKYWKGSKEHEAKLDKVDEHPLVQKFQNFHDNYGTSPSDYRQIKNLGVFEHPDGSRHIVARDHGFNSAVEDAYKKAHLRKNSMRL